MKLKSILFIGFLLLSAFAAGCGGELEEPTSRSYETFDGEFMSLGSIKVNQIVTHLFETDEGEILYAYSERYDLDDEEYFGKRVEAYGVLMEYESLDKQIFEVRRITEANEKSEDDENVEDVDYKDTDLGVSFTYPDNWELTALRDGIQLEASAPKVETDVEEDAVTEEADTEDAEEAAPSDAATVEIQPDYIIISNVGEVLTGSSEDDQNAMAAEIKSYVTKNYESFVGLSAEMSYVGVDKQFAVKYKTSAGEMTYFVPRHGELFELSFFHPEEEDFDKLKNSNIFAEIVSSFRFLPYGEDAVTEETVTEDVQEDLEEEVAEDSEEEVAEKPVAVSSGSQASVSSYREFESNPYHFKISYPGSWYYSGGNGGYDFSNEPIEDDTEAVIRLDFNVKTGEGVTTSGSSVSITVLVGDRYYTLSGPSEYQNVMQYMADSVQVLETE